MKIIPSIVTLLFLIAAGTVSSPAQNATTVEPLLVYKALQDKDCRHWVDSVMDKLSFKEKVGQLFIYTIAPVDTKRNLELLREVIDTYKVGGLLFSGGKMQNQVELTNRAQRQAKVPLMITFDGEWGLAMRLRGMPVFPRNMVLGCIRDNKLLYEYGREVARQCRQIGVQVNFAPVADVNINPENPVINTRSFGEDPIQVADKVIAYASGLESGGVLSVCKHFPGHGDTDVDSHKALPVLPFTRERLDSVELYPFKEAIRAGLGGMMVGHLQVPVIEPIGGLPSSLSRNVVYDLLTDELAFKGLIFTDALAMKGVAGNGNVSLQALKAGNDMVLSPRNLKEEIPAVLEAIEKGELTREDIESKCRKVLTYKYVLGLKKKSYVQLSGLEQRIMKSVHRQDKRRVRHIGCKRFGVQFLLRGLYTHNDLLYFHTQLRNETNVPFDVDFVTFKIVDKKIVKRTAMQEQVIYPLRACNYVTRVDGKSSERTVFALPKFTIPEDKKLVVEMYEKQGGRHQMFEVDNEDLVRAEPVNELKVR